jgi:hypothetical protein
VSGHRSRHKCLTTARSPNTCRLDAMRKSKIANKGQERGILHSCSTDANSRCHEHGRIVTVADADGKKQTLKTVFSTRSRRRRRKSACTMSGSNIDRQDAQACQLQETSFSPSYLCFVLGFPRACWLPSLTSAIRPQHHTRR